MNNPLHILLVLGTAHLFTVMSPGPNQALVLAAGARSRTQGLLVAFGAWPAGATWAALGIAGMGEVIRSAPWLELAIRLLCGAYLLYLGVRLVRLSFTERANGPVKPIATEPWRLVLTGFLSNLSNPKAIAWYASIFTAAGAYDLPWQWQLVVIFGMPAIGFGWNSLLVFVVSSGPIKVLYTRAVRWIDRISGGILLVFGLKLLVAR
jgi:threonine efflux protein